MCGGGPSYKPPPPPAPPPAPPKPLVSPEDTASADNSNAQGVVQAGRKGRNSLTIDLDPKASGLAIPS